MKIIAFFAFFSAVLPLVVKADSILEIAQSTADFDTLATAIAAADLEAFFDEPWWCQYFHYFDFCEDKTVFAPKNDAFSALPAGALDRLLDPQFKLHLRDVLLYHAIQGTVTSSDVIGIVPDSGSVSLEAYNGEDLMVTKDPVAVNGNAVENPLDVVADNGIVHSLGSVLLPKSATMSIVDVAKDAGLTTLANLLETTGLDVPLDDAGMYTVFAPTEEAFAKLTTIPDSATLAKILQYHVISEDIVPAYELKPGHISTLLGPSIEVSINRHGFVLNDNVKIVSTNILANNGIIHLIDTVLIPPAAIGDVAESAGSFSTLVAALRKADLFDAINDMSQEYTVFAPTDEAFESVLGVDGIENLTPEELVPILQNHVISGPAVKSRDLIKQSSPDSAPIQVQTLNEMIDVLVKYRRFLWWVWVTGIFVEGQGNDSSARPEVVDADIGAANGVIHAVDNIILPSPSN